MNERRTILLVIAKYDEHGKVYSSQSRVSFAHNFALEAYARSSGAIQTTRIYCLVVFMFSHIDEHINLYFHSKFTSIMQHN